MKLFFCKYHYLHQEDKIDYFLIGNKCNGDYLLSEWKEVDYLLKISGDYSEKQLENLIETLKTISSIQLVKKISPESIKSIDNLIFD